MLSGEVTPDGVVLISLPVAGQDWPAAIDTGFNSQLELPEKLFRSLRPMLIGQIEYELAAGQTAVEDLFSVDFPFDGRVVAADATFVDSDTILIGTGLLRDHHLEIDFPAETVHLERTR